MHSQTTGKIRFNLIETRATGAITLALTGAAAGSAAGAATISKDEDPVALVNQCAGAGISEVGVDINLGTTPALSG